MYKAIFFFLSLFLSSGAQAQALTVNDFNDHSMFDYVYVEKAERVFVDELVGEELYQVTYLVEGECASYGEGDACELVSYCEYIWAESSKKGFDLFGTEMSCDQDIEDVLGVILVDEL